MRGAGVILTDPKLTALTREGLTVWTDSALAETGILIGFTERGGGVSEPPYASLNLAAHVGDDPIYVDENRRRLLEAVGLVHLRDRLTMPDQVHGDVIAFVGNTDAGSGAHASMGRPPIPSTDALVTLEVDVPLMLCFADCVPVVLVSPGHGVAVAHAGWRGALASIPGKTATELACATRCNASDIRAYIGAHVRACHYSVGDDIMSQFCNTFGTVARAVSGGLDLDAAVTASLVDAGVKPCSIARLGTCTAEATDRFFSYRSEDGRTGRHSAFACLLSSGSSQFR